MDDLDPIPLEPEGADAAASSIRLRAAAPAPTPGGTDATIVTPGRRADAGSPPPPAITLATPTPPAAAPTIAPAAPPTVAPAAPPTVHGGAAPAPNSNASADAAPSPGGANGDGTGTRAGAANGAPRVRIDPIIGKEIGGATISALVGEGGMGRVYLGTTSAGLRVAVKLLSRGFDNPEAIGRFQREAAILDRLRHPGIAEMKGHGVWDDGSGGIPYLLLEFVEDAKTLADFALEHRLDLRGRLELFHRACEAVAFAHEMKILHRDLKPANLLVDRYGRVKVIDFGVARASNGDLGVASVRTETGQLIGTVQYMSPEQIGGDPRAIDLRTDVYALGVILYEMLVSAFPYDVRGLPLPEAARIVSMAQVEPPRLIDPSIDAAIDAIAMRCLERDREKRFSSAGSLARALERYLYPPPIAAGSGAAVVRGRTAEASDDAPNDDLALDAPPERGGRGSRPADARIRSEGARAPRRRAAGGGGFRRHWRSLLAIVVVAAGAAAVATGRVRLEDLRRLIPGGSGGGGSPAGASAEPAAINMENLTVLSAPEGALVTVDGATQGRTPLTMMVAWTRGSTARSVEVSAPGFETGTALVLPDPAGNRSESVRLVFNLAPAAGNREPALERLLPLRVDGDSVELRLPNGRVETLRPGLREVKLSLPRQGDSFAPVKITLRAPGRRIDAFQKSAQGELVIPIDPRENLDQPFEVRIAKP